MAARGNFGALDGMTRSPTFFVGAERQKKNLEEFQRREQQLAEAYHKNKPLCFNARSYQKTHPIKAMEGHKDADVCLTAPLVLGVADGVSQIEEFGIDASRLPSELMQVIEELGMYQLVPGQKLAQQDSYLGPVNMLRRAFEATEELGSLTVVLAIMDNSSKIHGKLHPMVAIITVGDCELLVLRRVAGRHEPLQDICHTDMQRIDGHAQTPLQLARVDDRIDPNFHEGITIEVIEKGSAVHCVSAYEGDIIVMGSDGVFDNLFRDEIVDMVNSVLKPGEKSPIPPAKLGHLAQLIVEACHSKTRPGPNGAFPEAPIGRGGKKDDTSCVVAEVIEWSDEHQRSWAPAKKFNPVQAFLAGFPFERCCQPSIESDGSGDENEERSEKPRPAAIRKVDNVVKPQAPQPAVDHAAPPQAHNGLNGGAPPQWAQLQPGNPGPWGTYPTPSQLQPPQLQQPQLSQLQQQAYQQQQQQQQLQQQQQQQQQQLQAPRVPLQPPTLQPPQLSLAPPSHSQQPWGVDPYQSSRAAPPTPGLGAYGAPPLQMNGYNLPPQPIPSQFGFAPNGGSYLPPMGAGAPDPWGAQQQWRQY